MKKILPFSLLLIFVTSCSEYQVLRPPFDPNTYYFYDYQTDVTDCKNHVFNVQLSVDSLNKDNDEFVFISSVPGSYSILDIGRFVKSFNAFDEAGNNIPVQKVSVNKFKILEPEKVRSIKYSVKETSTNKPDSNAIPEMSGTVIDSDHVLLNPHCVFGYIKGLKDKPFRVQLIYPSYWTAGTSLYKNYQNYYYTKDFDELIDSPFLLGNLSKKEFNVDDIDISLYTWSKTRQLESKEFKGLISDVVDAEVEFMERKPVDNYTFLFLFGDRTVGAHEHKHSSTYIFKEKDYDKIKNTVMDVTAHEFYHLQTPLTFSEKILKQFDYENPVPTEHLWFYEGVVEWAANTLLFRAGLTNIDYYLHRLNQKLDLMEDFDKKVSLTDLSLHSYSRPDQYTNIYEKGAVTAAMLDLYIIEKTDAQKGLREVVNSMTNAYLEKPIDGDMFFKEFISYSHPAVESFINSYIKRTEPLYLSDYFDPLAITYKPYGAFYNSHLETLSDFGFYIWQNDSGAFIVKVPDSRAESIGFRHNDTLISINSTKLDTTNIESILRKLEVWTTTLDVPYTALVKRGNKEIEIKAATMERWKRHVFSEEIADERALRRRKMWFGK